MLLPLDTAIFDRLGVQDGVLEVDLAEPEGHIAGFEAHWQTRRIAIAQAILAHARIAVVTTNPATNVTTSSATLNGSLDPHGLTTSVYFQYGTTTSRAHHPYAESDWEHVPEHVANISGLAANIEYHFGVATNSGGPRYGSDRTFTTP